MALRQAIIADKDFLRALNKAKDNKQLRYLILQASPKSIRTLQNVISAHLDDSQSIPIDATTFRKLKASRKLNLLKKCFAPTKKLCPVEEARSQILKVISTVKSFVHNVVSS